MPATRPHRLKVLIIFIGSLNALSLMAQTEAADFSRIGFAGALTAAVSDYQAVGINPANLGFPQLNDLYQYSSPIEGGIDRRKRQWALTLAEGGFTAHSDALQRGDLWDALFQSSSFNFTQEQKRQAAEEFINRGLRFSTDVILLGASYQSNAWGGVALTIRERIAGTFQFNESASRLAFEGRFFDYFDSTAVNFRGDTVGYARNPQRYSTLFDGTRLALTWYREYGITYGVTIVNKDSLRVSVGAGAKYLQGYAYLDAEVRSGSLQARSALSPLFGINYGKATSPSMRMGTGFESVGMGWAVDVGITVQFEERWTIAASAIDIGAMMWDGNVFIAKDTILNGLSSTGFANYNIFEQAPQVTGEGNFFQWEGLTSAQADLPARLRLGLSYEYSKRWRFGADYVAPFNRAAGALGEPIISVGVDWRPTVWLTVSSGVGTGGNMGPFIPIGIMASLFGGFWEIGIQSRDVATLIIADRPILSLCTGLARFRW